jgi:hypothetical protein
VIVVLSNPCAGKAFSYKITEGIASLLDPAHDVHDAKPEYDAMARTASFAKDFVKDEDDVNGFSASATCISNNFTITVYPTEQFESSYRNNEPILFTIGVLAIFIFTALAFMVFDWLSQRRQHGLMTTALRQNALVSSLFPKNIQKKLMEEIEEEATKNKTGKAGLRTFLNNCETTEGKLEEGGPGKSKPIADLFPETTIMFADIAGQFVVGYCRGDCFSLS